MKKCPHWRDLREYSAQFSCFTHEETEPQGSGPTLDPQSPHLMAAYSSLKVFPNLTSVRQSNAIKAQTVLQTKSALPELREHGQRLLLRQERE